MALIAKFCLLHFYLYGNIAFTFPENMKILHRFNQQKICEKILATELMNSINVSNQGQVEITSCSWNDYWNDDIFLNSKLKTLHTAWCLWIESRFCRKYLLSYVAAYFDLLESSLESVLNGNGGIKTLQKVLHFESVTIKQGDNSCAAAIFSNRHPAYLLCKLANVNCVDDPKYLPVIAAKEENSPALFVHYRRIAIEKAFGNQMFVYRSASNSSSIFQTIDFLFRALTPRNDPWVKYRSEILYDRAFRPCLHSFPNDGIRLLDLGCGSGQVSMNLCAMAHKNDHKSFHLNLLDIQYSRFSIANSFWKHNSSFQSVKYIRSDIFSWLHSSLSNLPHFDIALLLRVLDIRSKTTLTTITRHKLISLPDSDKRIHDDFFEKTSTLLRANSTQIIHSLRKVRIGDDWFFLQPGLKDYFHALYLHLVKALFPKY